LFWNGYRFWGNAAVIAVPNFEADPVWQQGGVEALAYISEGVTHVGTLPEGDKLFYALNNEEVAIGMRLGHDALLAVMGIWLPDQRHFEETPDRTIINYRTPVDSFHIDYPGLLLG
jgi:hypothetical protein